MPRLTIFKIQDCRKSEMHPMTPEWPQAFNCHKYPVYIEYSAPEAQISLRFALWPAIFSTYNWRLSKIVNTPNDPRMILSTSLSKESCIHCILTSDAHISLSFALQLAVFEIQGCRESEMHRMTPEWRQLSQVLCIHWMLTPEAQISLRVALWSLAFQILRFFISP